MILRLYYVYEKSPKKYRELDSIVGDLKQAFNLAEGGNRPIRSCGTRWITHKQKALRVIDCYGVYIAHLSSFAEDNAVKAADRVLLVVCALYIDALRPLSLLSLTLQRDDADIVSSIENTLKSAEALQLLAEKDPHEWPSIKLLRQSISDSDGQQKYQAVPRCCR